jgi:hypothetical protein
MKPEDAENGESNGALGGGPRQNSDAKPPKLAIFRGQFRDLRADNMGEIGGRLQKSPAKPQGIWPRQFPFGN